MFYVVIDLCYVFCCECDYIVFMILIVGVVVVIMFYLFF